MPPDKAANLFVLAAPSGAGKTTLVKELVAAHPDIRFSVSFTTRDKRVNEVEGEDYFFVHKEEFLRLRESDELLESALVFDNHYGTSRSQVEQHLADGHNVLLEIDWQGAAQVRESMPGCVTVFILAPSREELERRLRDRKTDSAEIIERRLRDALSDMSHWREFDYVIINDDLADAVAQLDSILYGNGAENRVDNSLLTSRVVGVLGS
jgi:guanylate kinase